MRTGKKWRLSGLILLLVCMVLLCGMTGAAAEKKVSLSQSNLTIKKGSTMQLKLKRASGKVKWSSSKKSVASVTASGKVKAKKVGTCEITAVYKKKTYTCTVEVTKTRKESLLEQYPAKKNTGKILLAGSSSMARWSSAAQDFAPYEVLNMAMGGTTMKQWSNWYKSMIIPYEPEVVVWYVGGNDLWHKTSPAKTAQLFCETVKKLHKALPNTKVYFVSVYTNLSRKSISRQILTYNKKIKEFCKKNSYITYIDLAAAFNNSETSLKNLLEDGLHPNQKGYEIWRDVVAAKVKADMRELGIEPTGSITDSTNDSSDEMIITGTEIYEDEVIGEVNQTDIQ